MKRIIAKVSPMFHGHLMLEFENGGKLSVFRDEHEAHNLKPGDVWPPEAKAAAVVAAPEVPAQ